MALILNIDSSLEQASVSIAKDGHILAQAINNTQKEHAAFIHTAIEQQLKNIQQNISALDAIATTIGPGSYTGLRVCLSAAKGLSYALNKPLITIGTLEAMAYAAVLATEKPQSYLFCPMIDARRMEVYTALYDFNLTEIIAPHAEIITPQFLEEKLLQNQMLFFGNGMDKFKEQSALPISAFLTINSIVNSISLLSHKRMEEKKFSTLLTAVPTYAKEFYNP